MKLHGIWLAICILAALIVGVSVYGWTERRVGARVALAQHKADSTQAVMDSLKAQAKRDSAAVAETLSVTNARLDQYRHLAAAAALAGKTATAALRATLTAIQQAQLDSITAAHAGELHADSLALATEKARAAFLIAGLTKSVESWRSIALTAQQQNEANLKRSAPRFSCGPGGGITVGLGGSAVGPTFSCHWNL